MMHIPFRKNAVQRDIDDELRFHFDARIEELVEQGASRDDAHRQALAEFGDVNDVRSGLREIDDRLARRKQRAETFDVLRQDVIYALRSLRRTPGVSITIILTLALGLGLNAAMFSFLDVIFLRPPAGVAKPNELRRVWARWAPGREYWPHLPYAGYRVLEEAIGRDVDLAIYGTPAKTSIGRDENPPIARVVAANTAYFRVLGVKPAAGRLYTADEDQLDHGSAVVVISDAFWRRHLDGDSAALGRQIVLADASYTIIGIMPPEFTGVDLDAADAWHPLATDPRTNKSIPWYRDPDVNGFQILFREPASARARERELEQRSTRVLRQPGVVYAWDSLIVAKFGPIVAARGPGAIGSEVQVATRLAGVAVIVLVIAFANVVNLLLARAVRRRREIAVRLALGISQSRLVRLLVTESVLLALAASIAALAAATWGGGLLRRFLMPGIAWAGNSFHWRVLLFGVLLAVIAGAAAGLVPALQSRAPDLTNALKAGAREGGGARSRLRGMLVVAQAALSVVLLVGAALFAQSLRNVQHLDIGYAVDRLAFISVATGAKGPVETAAKSDRFVQLAPRFAAIPGVERVAFASLRPKYGMQFMSYFPETDTVAHKKPEGMYTAVSPDFFATTGTRVISGRAFAPSAGGDYTVMINQAMADALWPHENALGRCIRFDKADAPCATVIGVTQTALLGAVKEEPSPHVYLPLDNMPMRGWGARDVILRADPARMTSVLMSARAIIKAEFPNGKLDVNTMAAAMEPEYRPWRLGATLFTLFGALAALVAAIGIYSTVSYAVNQRVHEFGIRAALGADATSILGHVLGEGVRTVAIGVVLGIAVSLAAGRLVAALLFGVSADNPLAMVLAGVTLLAVAAVASLAPAWRASRSDPAAALRTE